MKKSEVKITFNDEQLQIEQGSAKKLKVKWSEITSIQVFKRDLLAVDEICMKISTSEGKLLEINEEMTGWDDLVKSIPKYLEECTSFEEWFPKVAHPPMETNLTEIYESRNHAV